jgi:hypothetical protein
VIHAIERNFDALTTMSFSNKFRGTDGLDIRRTAAGCLPDWPKTDTGRVARGPGNASKIGFFPGGAVRSFSGAPALPNLFPRHSGPLDARLFQL